MTFYRLSSFLPNYTIFCNKNYRRTSHPAVPYKLDQSVCTQCVDTIRLRSLHIGQSAVFLKQGESVLSHSALVYSKQCWILTLRPGLYKTVSVKVIFPLLCATTLSWSWCYSVHIAYLSCRIHAVHLFISDGLGCYRKTGLGKYGGHWRLCVSASLITSLWSTRPNP